jgi:hypothetical protein
METYRERESGRKRARERERERDTEIPVYLIKLSPIARLNYADLITHRIGLKGGARFTRRYAAASIICDEHEGHRRRPMARSCG